jgi:hypothetical protein
METEKMSDQSVEDPQPFEPPPPNLSEVEKRHGIVMLLPVAEGNYQEPPRPESIKTLEDAMARIADLETALEPFAVFAQSAKNNFQELIKAGCTNMPMGGTWVGSMEGPQLTTQTLTLFFKAGDVFGRARSMESYVAARDRFYELQAAVKEQAKHAAAGGKVS